MIPTREVNTDGWRVRLDPSRQVLRLEVPEDYADWGEDDQALSPGLPVDQDNPVSAATLLLKGKQFDDGLYAAVDPAAQQGAGRFAGKAKLLGSLGKTLAKGLPGPGIEAAVAIHTACGLGGLKAPLPDSIAEGVRTARAAILAKLR